ncbi:aspartyl protease family protein [Psychroserpens sp. XS_ASV72]|uniref:retropepsin-like aspartic protease n=1 Tax=Psychroserpens sp. XS_ASV72 TaxID=3241293 RepID=UPI003510D722
MLKKLTCLIFFVFVMGYSFSQNNFSLPNQDKDKIKFELIGNLIVLPVELNGVELSFVLDSGVSKPILFNLANLDSLQINKVETIKLRGLGGGEPVEAIKSRNNFLKVGNALNINQDIYVVFDSALNFTPRLGTPIHGIIGFDLLKDFVVEINYAAKFIVLHRPSSYSYKKCRKCETFNLSFYNNKPYMVGEVMIDTSYVPIKLLIDTGSSDALWIFENKNKGLMPDDNKYFEDFLGKGLSGNIYGKRSKVRKFKLKSYELDHVNTAFPDSSGISFAMKNTDRDGSLSGEMLKRFNVIMDYRNCKITLKKNRHFKDTFSYNKGGIVLEQNGVIVVKEAKKKSEQTLGMDNDFNTSIDLISQYKLDVKPAYTIVQIREGSPAERVGLKIGDIVLSVNGKETHTMKLQNVISFFKSKTGKLVNLRIDRDGKIMLFEFKLEDVFK